jgi:hypothetical protein
MAALHCPCQQGIDIWGEVWWVGGQHRWVFFDDEKTSETYAQQITRCPGCGKTLERTEMKAAVHSGVRGHSPGPNGPEPLEGARKDSTITSTRGAPGKEQAMKKKQRVAEMADEVLARQAKARAERTGEPFEVALEAVRKTEAGQQLGELGEGPHRHESADQWQEDMSRERAEERRGERGLEG